MISSGLVSMFLGWSWAWLWQKNDPFTYYHSLLAVVPGMMFWLGAIDVVAGVAVLTWKTLP